jgi:Subtilase family
MVMRLRLGFVCLLAMAMSIAPASGPFLSPLAAQDADNDDDDDGGDAGEDDGDVADPDDADPGADDDIGGDDVGGDDVGGDDAGGDDAGGDDAGGDDAGGDDDGAGGDDDGAAGGDDDGAAGGDDDGASGGDDDDGAAGGDDDGGNDDITDDRGDGNDAGDDDLDDDPGQWEGIGGESEVTRAELDARDRIDLDGEGFRYRRGEFIALDLAPDDLAELTGSGFEVIAREQLASVDGTLLLLRGPARLSGEAALDALEDIADPDSIGYNHLFDSSSVQTKRARTKTVPERQACGCDIGLIDTGVATGLTYFKHVTLVQRAFNAKDPTPKLHGTAVAHLMAGTRRSAARATKIYVADIFGGPRETSGSSFALIKALDWLAVQGVPVINVSLSGPRNPAVAKAIARVTRKGHTVVAAAGNDGPAAPPVFPGAYEGVIAVTAVDDANRVYRYANRGSHVDFSARGVAVPAIDAKGAVRDATGTSFAAPIIAARLAAQLRNPDGAAAQKAIRALEAEARDLGPPGRDTTYGAGLIGGGN